MGIIQVILICMGLSLDSFVVMMEKGASLKKLKASQALGYALLFSITGCLAVSLGYGISYLLKSIIVDRVEVWLAGIFLFVLGAYIIFSFVKSKKFEEKLDPHFSWKECFILAIVTNIDALLLGASLAFLNIGLVETFASMFVIAFIGVLVALYIGNNEGARYQKIIGICGGTMLIVLSFYIQLRGIIG